MPPGTQREPRPQYLVSEEEPGGQPDSWLELAPERRVLRLPRDEHPVLTYLASLAPGSRRTMRTALETIAGMVSSGDQEGEARADALSVPWWRMRYQHTSAIRARLAERYAPATANKMLSALKGVLRECFALGYMGADDLGRALNIKQVRGTRLPPGRSIAHGELYALFRICAEDEKRARGARDAAILALLYVCGLRRAEVVALKVSDYDPDALTVRVRGKGSKERVNYAEGGANRLLDAWLRLRGTGDAEGPLFLPVNKGGRIVGEEAGSLGDKIEKMSDAAVYKMLRRRQKEAGVKGLSPHDFRKTFVGDLLDEGADLSVAQQLAGHADPKTTARYDRRGERAKRRATGRLHVPYYVEDKPLGEDT